MNPKRWIAAIAALVLAGAASIFVASPAMSHGDEEHPEEETTTTAPMEHEDGHNHEEEVTTTVPADDGGEGEPEPAPEVPGEPGFTG